MEFAELTFNKRRFTFRKQGVRSLHVLHSRLMFLGIKCFVSCIFFIHKREMDRNVLWEYKIFFVILQRCPLWRA